MKTKHLFFIILLLTGASILFMTSCEKDEENNDNTPDYSVNMEMIPVDSGSFEMGCTSEQTGDCDTDESPVHTVTLDSFKISKYEITNQQFANFMNAIGANSDGTQNGTQYLYIDRNNCRIKYDSGEFTPEDDKANYPVVEVTWHGAKAFCENQGGRLPYEAEWEYAARGGSQNSTTNTKYAGSNTIDDVAWYVINSGGNIHEVGTKSPNELGIYDMSGNVWEWCNDWYGSNYYNNSPQNNPQGPADGSSRVLRGGGWNDAANFCRVSRRGDKSPDEASRYHGFRLVRPF